MESWVDMNIHVSCNNGFHPNLCTNSNTDYVVAQLSCLSEQIVWVIPLKIVCLRLVFSTALSSTSLTRSYLCMSHIILQLRYFSNTGTHTLLLHLKSKHDWPPATTLTMPGPIVVFDRIFKKTYQTQNNSGSTYMYIDYLLSHSNHVVQHIGMCTISNQFNVLYTFYQPNSFNVKNTMKQNLQSPSYTWLISVITIK